jgi:hypothetical protein
MKPSKPLSVEEFKVCVHFESLRKVLLTDRYARHLEKPLACWVLPADRRLPLALLGRTLHELLGTPFAELTATPGIGEKKIRSFVKLLARAAETDPAELPMEGPPESNGDSALAGAATCDGAAFDPAAISEVVWARWRAAVVRHGLGREKLGRFAPSLRDMTRVIWQRPLEDYTGHTLAEIRAMKTHGEKRLLAILEVFHNLYTLVAGMGTRDHLVVRIVPRAIDAVEDWTGRVLQTPGVPGRQEILDQLIRPLLEQVHVDATEQIAALAENRLGLSGPITSIRQAAREMGLTRARVYQLLNEINDILDVRWPTGRRHVYELRSKFLSEVAGMADPPDLAQFHAAIELFYPGGRRGAAGPLAGPREFAPQETDKESEPSAAAGVASP